MGNEKLKLNKHKMRYDGVAVRLLPSFLRRSLNYAGLTRAQRSQYLIRGNRRNSLLEKIASE